MSYHGPCRAELLLMAPIGYGRTGIDGIGITPPPAERKIDPSCHGSLMTSSSEVVDEER